MQSSDVKTPRAKASALRLAYVAFIMLGLPSGLLGVAWPSLRAEFGLPLDAMGLALLSFTAGYFLASPLVAGLTKRFGIAALLIFSSLALAAANLSYPLAPDWSVFVAIGVVAGFGGAVLDVGLNTYLAAQYGEGEMQWLHAAFGIGCTLSPIVMTASLSRLASWRPGYALVGACMLAMGAAMWLTRSAWKAPGPASEANAGSGDKARGWMEYHTPLGESLRQAQTWAGVALFVLYTGAELTLGNWTYTLLTEGRGIGPQIAGIFAGGFWAIFTLGRVLAGLYSQRVRLHALMLAAMSLALAGSILFWWNPLPWAGVLAVFVVGLGTAPIFPGLVSSTSQRVGELHAANAIGVQMSAACLGGAVLPALAGFLARRASLEAIPAMLAISLAGLLALYWLCMRVTPREADPLGRAAR